MAEEKAHSFLPQGNSPTSRGWFDIGVTDAIGKISFSKPDPEFTDAFIAFCQVQDVGKYFAVVTTVGVTVEVSVYDDTGSAAPA